MNLRKRVEMLENKVENIEPEPIRVRIVFDRALGDWVVENLATGERVLFRDIGSAYDPSAPLNPPMEKAWKKALEEALHRLSDEELDGLCNLFEQSDYEATNEHETSP